ncbi:pro-melanin-concentrating hormone, like [Onychostoma macrolepis]|uniref:pro-melanin-concentrating hormone, like n=1 Tax=Onychostoma macrolepis TaxID=369639 RepID=UPI00272BF5C9|nr:pro-melanin-concentrating hormone, like [Onychostoma macrolepis]
MAGRPIKMDQGTTIIRPACKTSQETATEPLKKHSGSRMKLSVGTVLITVALLSECYFRTAATPMTKAEDMEPDLQSLSESLEENSLRSGPGNSRIIVVTDSNLLRTLTSLNRGLPHLSLPESLLSTERRDVGTDLSPSIAIIKRDTMRCMVGRVYRPCWEV